MNKNILTIIAINIIFLVLIMLFVNYKLDNSKQSPILNTGTIEQPQNSDFKNDVSTQKDAGPKYDKVGGTIKEISNNQVVIELTASPHETGKVVSTGDLSFVINGKSKILKAEIKDQKIFEEENKQYQSKSKEINDQIAKNPNYIVENIAPPLPYTTKNGNLSDLKVNSKIFVVFDQTVTDKPLATEITVMP